MLQVWTMQKIDVVVTCEKRSPSISLHEQISDGSFKDDSPTCDPHSKEQDSGVRATVTTSLVDEWEIVDLWQNESASLARLKKS